MQKGHELRLRHTSDLYFTPRWARLRLGQLTYTYTFDARSMLIDAEAPLELEPGREVTDVVLTIANDAHDFPFFTSIGADTQPTGNPLFSAAERGLGRVDMADASYLFDQTRLHLARRPRDSHCAARAGAACCDRDRGAACRKAL
jgi:hypothetical protein